MYELVLVIFLIESISLIILIMLQQVNMNSSFSYSNVNSTDMFLSSSSSSNFMTKLITVFAAIFFFLSLVLVNFSNHQYICGTEWEDLVTREDMWKMKKNSLVEDIPY
ncbi:Protein-export membrane protein secG [Candidatus Westeberhardia cardiocondylae]|uniref:Protein-export membrane protein SecG n=1 Tax=Candidatus Westeberhardia cardiocondylae TaxID=1594731 RepID=A0A0H5BWR2_9ENTR|nr:preprotein translocase subunit SecG [Candidatus Westeberhardia cardiocondylae]MCR3756505.1 Sec translocon subunit SecG [Candidatus Westeberhardia cardiocondylae]CEN32150.1 Protein-export membrane protein secG [Candidatus Westeberhardia cardiocondylae]